MGRRPDDPAVQEAKGFPNRRKAETKQRASKQDKAQRRLEELMRLAAQVAKSAADADGVPMMLSHPAMTIARQVWKDHVPALETMNIIHETDKLMFCVFCIAVSDYFVAENELLTEGNTYRVKTTSGSIGQKAHPAIERKKTAEKLMMDLSDKYALTPQARMNIMKLQAGGLAGGLFDPRRTAPPEAAVETPAAPAEEEIVGALSGFDSPPPGTQVN